MNADSRSRLWRWPLRALIAVAALWMIASAVVLPPMAISVADNPVVDTPADVGLSFEAVEIASDGLALEGWWIPASDPVATLMFVHGAGSNRTSWFIHSLDLYRAMNDLGVSVLTVDLRNHGNSPHTDGTLGMGAEEWPDVHAMAQWLDQRGVAQKPRLAMGASMGGATVIHALSHGLTLDGAILFDPALNTEDSLAQGGWIRTGLPAPVFKPYAWMTTRFWGLPYGTTDAQALADSINIPTLVLQDPADPITRLPFARALAEVNPNVSLALAPATPADAECVAGKGRWGVHVAAFACHPEWFIDQVSGFLANLGAAPKLGNSQTQ